MCMKADNDCELNERVNAANYAVDKARFGLP